MSPKHHDHSRSFKAENTKFDDRNITTRFSSHIVCVDLIHRDRSGESNSHCQFGRRYFSPQRLEKLRNSYLGRLKKKRLGMSLKRDKLIMDYNVVTDHDNTHTRVESCCQAEYVNVKHNINVGSWLTISDRETSLIHCRTVVRGKRDYDDMTVSPPQKRHSCQCDEYVLPELSVLP